MLFKRRNKEKIQKKLETENLLMHLTFIFFFNRNIQRNYITRNLIIAWIIHLTSSWPVQKEQEKYMTKFSHRKVLVSLSFSSVIWPLVIFR
jgi:hypothetical protein